LGRSTPSCWHEPDPEEERDKTFEKLAAAAE
jgi:hypothetical protein